MNFTILIVCLIIIIVFLYYNKKLFFTATTIPDGTKCTINNQDPNGNYAYIGDTCTLTYCKPGYDIINNSCVLRVAGAQCTNDFCPVNGNCTYNSNLICNVNIDKPCMDGYGYNQGVCYSTGTDCLATGLYSLQPDPNASYTIVPDANNYADNCQFNCNAFFKKNSTDNSCAFIPRGSCTISNPDPNAIYSYDDNGICVAKACQYGYDKDLYNTCVKISDTVTANDISKDIKFPNSTTSPLFALIGQNYL